MSGSDFLNSLKDKVIDAATYDLLRRNFDLLEENNAQLKEQASLLKEQVATQRARIQLLEKQNSKIKSTADAARREEEFRVRKGMAFKKKGDGRFSDQPYCPHCYKVMGVMEDDMVTCSPCKHSLTLGNTTLQEIATWLDRHPE